jgi:hypothetical protein
MGQRWDYTTELENAGDFLLIDKNDRNSIYFKDGVMSMGGINFWDAINEKIDEVAKLARDKVLIKHNHAIKYDNFGNIGKNDVMTIEFSKTWDPT